jgi:hypothetical protein
MVLDHIEQLVRDFFGIDYDKNSKEIKDCLKLARIAFEAGKKANKDNMIIEYSDDAIEDIADYLCDHDCEYCDDYDSCGSNSKQNPY